MANEGLRALEWAFFGGLVVVRVADMRCRLLALAVVPLVLAGCSGDPAVSVPTGEHAPTTPMTYYPSPTTSAPAAAVSASGVASKAAASSEAPAVAADLPVPVMPAEAKANTPDGAAAFARHYVAVANYAWQKPDPAPLAAISAPECKSCAAFVEDAASYRRDRVHADRAAMIIKSSDPSVADDSGNPTVIVVTNQAPVRMVQADGSQSEPADAERLTMQVTVRRGGTSWLVSKIKTVS